LSVPRRQEETEVDESNPIIVAINELVWSSGVSGLECSGPASEADIAAAEKALEVSFPKSYRTFLRHFGVGYLNCFDVYGVPGDRLWGDVVMMNQLDHRSCPKRFVKFTDDVGDYGFYLDTSRMDPLGECPVVVFGPGKEGEIVAEDFLDFLHKVRMGLI
jgi:hypothetical protein